MFGDPIASGRAVKQTGYENLLIFLLVRRAEMIVYQLEDCDEVWSEAKG